MKRMTLLAKKEGLSTSDFRAYWAGPHAALALGMDGIAKYTHNRVDKVLWASGDRPAFDVDGIVELYFEGAEAMRLAQASPVGQKFIPADEPIFLKGWTLCVVETDGVEPAERAVKVIVPFHASSQSRESLWRELLRIGDETNTRVALNWTASTARRERLWAEPNPPTGFICVWLESVAKAHEAFEPSSGLRRFIEGHVSDAVAYLINELSIR
ncbi:EthD domain-containing protein [Variovorax sp. J22R133]|uniref:EthD domain-containing protein n=1 Tax=Variovorax brevis TaxID=3053503 RepID=UPI002577E08B|nr:EthD domain-containing protein [Variovorax sp. J22R133]MDM0113716.1 EthD domain-containing protein [Variovorax sp. J22R133]